MASSSSTAPLPSFEQLMASLGLQDSRSRPSTAVPDSPSIVVSPAARTTPEDYDRERAFSFPRRTSTTRYAPYLADNRDIYSRRGSLPGNTSETSQEGKERSRSASTSPQAGTVDLDEMNIPANAPISSYLRRSHRSHSPPSPGSSTSASSSSPTSLTHRHRRSYSSASSSRSSPPPFAIPALPALIGLPTMNESPAAAAPRSANAQISRRASHQVHRQRSSGNIGRISSFRPYPSPTELTFSFNKSTPPGGLFTAPALSTIQT